MKITRTNYEIYFLDYLEGNLDNDLVNEFIEFLQQNPDLKEELQLAGSVKLEPEIIRYKNIEKLYKSKYDQKEEFEKAAVAFLEEDISPNEKVDFKAYLLANPEKQRDFDLFKQTKLQPDSRIVFPNKNSLYRSSNGKTILLWAARVAAVLAVAFLIYRFAGDVIFSRIQIENQAAYTENKNENPEPKNLPEKVEKKQDPASVKEQSTVPVKKSAPKAQPHKSLRESNNGRIDQEKVAYTRTPVVVPDKLPVIQASLQKNEVVITSLIKVKSNRVELPSMEAEERFLADIVKEKTGLDNLSLNKVTKAGLKLVSGFSREKFSFETNSDGQVTELNFDSRLLAFSIPTNQN